MRKGIQFGFVMILAVLIGNAVFAMVNTAALVETEQRVVHTHDVIQRLQAVLATLREAATEERGYLLTGDAASLKHFRIARDGIAAQTRTLRQLTQDNRAQQVRLDEFEPLLARQFRTFDREIAARPGPTAAPPMREEGTAVPAALLRVAGEMQDEEHRLLADRVDQASAVTRRLLWATGLATIFALTALLWEYRAVRQDFRRRERSTRALLDQRERYRVTLASIGDGVIVTDVAERVTFLNSVAEGLTGWGPDAVGRPLAEVFQTLTEPRHAIPLTNGINGRGCQPFVRVEETDLVARDGTVRPIDDSVAPLRDAAGGVAGAVVVFRDVTDRRRNREAVREQAALLDEATDAILVEDQNGCVTYWNRGAEQLYGWPAKDAVGREAEGLLGGLPLERAEALATVAADGEWAGELRQRRRDGSEIVVASRWTLLLDSAGRPRSRLVINTDVTEKKKLETQLLRAQRMESIGTLAGGIAHDLNNVLTPVLMGLDILRAGPPEVERLTVLDVIQTAAQRGADLVKQVLMFSRGAEGPRGVLSLKPLVAEVQRILTSTLPKGIAVRIEMPSDLWQAPVDATQFTQVLMNLCVNARDAMPNGGELLLRAENLAVDDHYARMHPPAKPGRYVAVTVSDTGDGIPPEVQARMFDPFFTTKPHGQGTGLGLPTALGIVHGHGGFVNVYSEPGRGARFVACFPASKSSKEIGPTVKTPLATGNGELILVVDDEAAIALITRHTLEAHGYKVMTAADGAEAVEIFRQHQADVRVVLTDMMMPNMDGPATIRAIRKLDAAVPFIAASGLTDPTRAAGDAAAEVSATLSKPFTAGTLLKTVRDVLTKAASG
jgi:two-component system cell cycle sensor histidine kinase/response regulator CckA